MVFILLLPPSQYVHEPVDLSKQDAAPNHYVHVDATGAHIFCVLQESWGHTGSHNLLSALSGS